MFTKTKREILGQLYIENGIIYTLEIEKVTSLMNKSLVREAIYVFKGKEKIYSWNIDKIKMDLRNSDYDIVMKFIKEYLKYPTTLRDCLRKSIFANESLEYIWDSGLGSEAVKESILIYQDAFTMNEFIENLSSERIWMVLTQNIFRNANNMGLYRECFKEITSEYMVKYLSNDNIEKYERVYGEWRDLTLKTFEDFYSKEDLQDVIIMSKVKCDVEKHICEKELLEIKNELKVIDKAYGINAISEKIRLEETTRNVLANEKFVILKIEDIVLKKERIETYFLSLGMMEGEHG